MSRTCMCWLPDLGEAKDEIKRMLQIFRAVLPKQNSIDDVMDYVMSTAHGWEEADQAQ